MIAGLGLDLVDVAAFRVQLADPASAFVAGTFTAAEQAGAPTGPGDAVLHLAARFAAKEAFVKAWSAARRGHPPAVATLDLREIEVVRDPWGRPGLQVHGQVRAAFGAGLRLHLSLSHDGPCAGAVVIVEEVP